MISNRDKKLFAHAMRVAELSECKFRHGATISLKGRVLGLGVNRDVYRPVERFLCGHERDHAAEKRRSRQETTHAEVDAIFRVASKTGLSRVTLYSARITKSGNPGSSYPCSSCQQIIKAVGVKRVVYFDGEKLAEWIP